MTELTTKRKGFCMTELTANAFPASGIKLNKLFLIITNSVTGSWIPKQ